MSRLVQRLKVSQSNQTFADVEDEEILSEIHGHLFLRFQLLDRVIRARKLHHGHFYSLNLDYGHQNFLDKLQSQKFVMLRALERLQRRTAEVLHEKQKWFKWVRNLEDEEEAHRENEQRKLKREAALFKRHWKEVETRMKELRAREEAKRQTEYLDKVYEESLSRQTDGDEDSDWDPIEDVVEDERGNYVNLIKHFLWEASDDDEVHMQSGESPLQEMSGNVQSQPPIKGKNDGDPDQKSTGANINQESAAKDQKAKKAKKKKPKGAQVNQEPGQVDIETKLAMRSRLEKGMELENGAGWVISGSIETPTETMWKTAPLPDDEIDRLLAEITEIKQLLLCRLLLSHAALLPIALRAESVQDFLRDPDVPESELRDLCLRMEQPGLQEIRDACADLGRGEESTAATNEKGAMRVAPKPEHVGFFSHQVMKKWTSKHEKSFSDKRKEALDLGNGKDFVDFGAIDDAGQYKIQKIRIKICGKYIYNYPSEKAMLRGGWLQFSIIAKGSSIFDAMALCRSWDEFYELLIPASFQYFPTSNWATWVGDRKRQQLLQLGFIPYMLIDNADQMTIHNQTGSRSYGMRRQHQVFEARNFICAHIKRNDATSRRLVQYLSMHTYDMVLLVRDAMTGDILVQPPEEELWLVREKSGIGRAAKNEWNVIKEVGPEFLRRWKHTGSGILASKTTMIS